MPVDKLDHLKALADEGKIPEAPKDNNGRAAGGAVPKTKDGKVDFDALREGFEACSDQLPDELEEPFNNRQDRFDERRQNRGAFEDCLREQGVGPEDRPGRGEAPDEADFDRLRGAFEECGDQLGEPFGGARG